MFVKSLRSVRYYMSALPYYDAAHPSFDKVNIGLNLSIEHIAVEIGRAFTFKTENSLKYFSNYGLPTA